ncbi:TPM domain-containing protein [Porphyrobacter sp. AAP60]|uniref:TPM domain-containing protein n=1 Tax=Porphyrobacter sp. AAP60 TaxID=1523423 RepID=UPI0006B92BE8|nr:TPM domain-containing protein [Porphyrobacter sp. AAP60]KPF63408.1 methanol dehydrogenase [Porphyrobacter sp. AAP60]
MIRHLFIMLALAGVWFAAPAAAQPQFPELTGRLVDNADLLTPEAEAALTAKLEALETQSQRQLVIATVPDLQGYDISDYGYQLGRAWGLGDESRNDGALLLVAPNDRKVRIEVGYGLEGYLTDALSALIIQNQILPAFRDGDFPGGIEAGTNAIITQLKLPPEEAAQIAAQAGKARESDGGFPIGVLIWLAFMFFFFVLPIFAGRKRRRKYRSKGDGPWGARGSSTGRDMGDTARDIILWEVGSAILRGALSGGDGDGGWGGGGFGGGGGFSGGGGSFGGGGASGGW